MNPLSLRDILREATDARGPTEAVPRVVLREEFERLTNRRLKVQSAVFLCLMGIGILVPNLEHMAGGIDGPRGLLLALVLVGFPLSWWVQARRAASWSLEQRRAWARKYEFANLASIALALSVVLFGILGHTGVVPFPSQGAFILSSLVTVPVLALVIHFAERKLSRWLDADWLE